MTRLEEIREKIHPTRAGYCAEPIDIEEARWLLSELDRLIRLLFYGVVPIQPRQRIDAIATTGCKVTTEKRE